MASIVYLDTHVAAWLYAAGATHLSAPARDAIEEAAELRISPMVRLELQYLFEIGRTTEEALPVVDALQSLIGLVFCESPFAAVIHEAAKQDWTRDPFDRIIVAQASLNNATLVTKDASIHSHYKQALW
ncbi:MAG: PIN domain-containing protein [Longimicrobiales bacterium]